MTNAHPSHRIVYAARHGETDWNALGRWQGHTDVPLNDAGRAQAAALGERLRAARIAAIVTSDLSRARETAEIVARIIDAPLAWLDPDLRERRFGVFEGLTRAQCEEHHADHYRRWREDARDTPPGAEPYADVQRRVTSAALRAAARIAPHDAPLLVVGHGGALRTFFGAVTSTPFGPIPNAALYRIDYDGARFTGVHLVEASREGDAARL
jgi:probable phosphoglycerate mutase